MPNLADLDRKLLLRLSESPDGKLWSQEERFEFLNDAQRLVAENLHSPETPWAQTLPYRTACVSGAEYYVMERDFLSIENVTHWNGGQPRQLTPSNIRVLRSNIVNSSYGYWYQWFELRGRTSPYVARGVATVGSSGNTLEDTSHTGGFGSVRVGDTLFNENDSDASAIVTAVTPTTLTVSEWVGGEIQAWTHGDAYRVAQRERDRSVLWVYPFIEFTGAIAYSGPVSNVPFSVELDDLITSISVTFGSLDPEWDANTDVRISIDERDTEVAAASVRGPRVGDAFNIDVEPFRVDHNRVYNVHAESPTGAVTTHIGNVTLYGQTEDNYLDVEYVPYPQPMLNERSICELQDFQLEPLLRQAKKLAWEKKDPSSPYIQQLLFEYEQALSDCEDTMLGRKPPGPEYTDGTDEAFDWWESQGFASRTGNVGELL